MVVSSTKVDNIISNTKPDIISHIISPIEDIKPEQFKDSHKNACNQIFKLVLVSKILTLKIFPEKQLCDEFGS